MKRFLTLLKDSFAAWSKDKVTVWSAALSYYTLFSLAPLLLIVISITGLIWGREAIEGSLYEQIDHLIGHQSALMIQEMVQNTSKQSTNILSSLIGFLILALGASGVFGQLKEAMNGIFNVGAAPKAGFFKMLKDKFLSFSMVVVIGFLLLVSLAASAAIGIFTTWFSGLLPWQGILIGIINFIVSLGLISLLFALLFVILPDVRIPWKLAFRGAILTAILFTIGKTALGLYIGQSSYTSTYGAAASLAIILVWVYYAGQILFFGAEFIKVYAYHNKMVLQPKQGATFLEAPEVASPLPNKTKPTKQKVAAAFTAGILKEAIKGSRKNTRKKRKYKLVDD